MSTEASLLWIVNRTIFLLLLVAGTLLLSQHLAPLPANLHATASAAADAIVASASSPRRGQKKTEARASAATPPPPQASSPPPPSPSSSRSQAAPSTTTHAAVCDGPPAWPTSRLRSQPDWVFAADGAADGSWATHFRLAPAPAHHGERVMHLVNRLSSGCVNLVEPNTVRGHRNADPRNKAAPPSATTALRWTQVAEAAGTAAASPAGWLT